MGIVLITHIAIALGGLAFTLFTLVVPSRLKIKGSYMMALLTLVSGTVLVVVSKAGILKTCLTGLAYLSLMLVGIYAAERRLAYAEARDKE